MKPDWLVLAPLAPWPLIVGPMLVALVGVMALGVRRRGASRLVWLTRAALVALAGLVALGPHLGVERVTYLSRPESQIVIALDRTASMAVRDVGGSSRLEQAAQDLTGVAQALESPMALVTWGAESRVVVPFTSDSDFLTRALSLVETEPPVAGVGSRVDRPLDTLARLIARAGVEREGYSTYLLVVSDGENTEAGEQRSFARLTDGLAGGLVLGYGTESGGPIPISPDDPLEQAAFVPDPDGDGSAVSRRGEENLRRVASDLGVEYRGWEDLSSIEAVSKSLVPASRLEQGTPIPHDVTWAVALVLLLLLAFELRGSVFAAREAVRMARAS